MIQNILQNKYGDALKALDIYETKTSLILSRIIINPDNRTSGIGTNVMTDLVNYADGNGQIIALTPSSDFGGNVNRLVQFYKRFGFKMNKGNNKNFEFKDTMIRYPKLPGMKESFKPLIKTLLRETLLTKDKKDISQISNFINFAKKILNINDDIKVELAYERTPDLKTTAYYNLDGFIKVYVKDRAIIDVCRSIAHELVHHKQNLDGRLLDAAKDGEDGSNIENEANAVAGVIIRKWGKMNPEFYN